MENTGENKLEQDWSTGKIYPENTQDFTVETSCKKNRDQAKESTYFLGGGAKVRTSHTDYLFDKYSRWDNRLEDE